MGLLGLGHDDSLGRRRGTRTVVSVVGSVPLRIFLSLSLLVRWPSQRSGRLLLLLPWLECSNDTVVPSNTYTTFRLFRLSWMPSSVLLLTIVLIYNLDIPESYEIRLEEYNVYPFDSGSLQFHVCPGFKCFNSRRDLNVVLSGLRVRSSLFVRLVPQEGLVYDSVSLVVPTLTVFFLSCKCTLRPRSVSVQGS